MNKIIDRDNNHILEQLILQKEKEKEELQRIIAQTPQERRKYKTGTAIAKSLEFMSSITPEHVSGRVYKVENGDGCGLFSLIFMAICGIVCLIVWIITK